MDPGTSNIDCQHTVSKMRATTFRFRLYAYLPFCGRNLRSTRACNDSIRDRAIAVEESPFHVQGRSEHGADVVPGAVELCGLLGVDQVSCLLPFVTSTKRAFVSLWIEVSDTFSRYELYAATGVYLLLLE